jgi:CheY-like chemotaxis protein
LESPDGDTCCNYQNLSKVDLFLLDISMPGMSGLLLVEALRKNGISVPIIMVSADAYETPVDSIPDNNKIRLYDDYITKPIRDSILLDKLANALNLTWCYAADTEKIITTEAVNFVPTINSNESFEGVTEADYRELISMAEIGFIGGINKRLTRLEESTDADRFVLIIRSYLLRYQFEKIIDVSKKGLL